MRRAQHTIGIRPEERSTYADQFYLLLLCVIDHFAIRLFLLHGTTQLRKPAAFEPYNRRRISVPPRLNAFKWDVHLDHFVRFKCGLLGWENDSCALIVYRALGVNQCSPHFQSLISDEIELQGAASTDRLTVLNSWLKPNLLPSFDRALKI